MESFDYVVVGGGTSGCVAAAKLVSAYNARVLVLEAGPDDAHPLLRMPAGFIKMLHGSRYLNFRELIPQSQLFGRTQIVPQANVLGGGSTVNAQVYLRGRAADWDAWRTLTGSDLWSWNAILPHFVAQEGNAKFNNEFHGAHGPMLISDPGYICEMSEIYVRAAQDAGIVYNPDFNDGNPRGTGFMQMTNRAGRRCSVVDAFIKPLKGDSRLTIKTGARVKRIVLSGDEAVAVEFEHQGAVHRVEPAREIILAAGVFSTPQLMMLSGIGPADELRKHGIDVAVDLPGIGENLQDHFEAPVMAETRRSLGYYKQDQGLSMLRNGLEYSLFKTRPGDLQRRRGVCLYGARGRRRRSRHPDLLRAYDYLPRSGRKGRAGRRRRHVERLPAAAALARLDAPALGRPERRAADQLQLSRRYVTTFVTSSKACARRDGFSQRKVMQKEVVREIFPGPSVESQTALEEHARRTVKTNYHPVGTCRMGRADDQMAVVTPDMKVRGVQRLRVIDMSVVPQLMSANTNGPAMAIGDRAADIIFGKVQGSSGV